MGWWKGPKSTSSTSSSPSSPARFAGSLLGGSAGQQPRLTRQRKVRHSGEGDALNFVADGAREAKSSPVSRSPSNLDALPTATACRSASSPTLLPHPLPLPEGVGVGVSSRRIPLPEPRAWDRSSFRIEGGGFAEQLAAPPQNGVVGRLPSSPLLRGAECFDTSAVLPTSCCRTTSQYLGAVEDDFRSNFPTRSAPSSAIGSPMLSPRRRPSSGEYFPSGYSTPQARQPFSASNFSDFVKGFHSQMPFEKFLISPEHSPLHSPTAKSPGLTTPSAPSSPLHPRIYKDNPSISSGTINVHPLPLPPGVPGPPHPPSGHPSPTKGDSLSMGSQWQKGKLIGSGTFGSVYEATNRHTGALCAMKEVNIVPDDQKSIECIKQLQQEIKILSQLEHPNIVKYYGSEVVEDHFYIYLEYVYPGSINKYIDKHYSTTITESVVRNFTRHILMGLAYLHSKSCIHRDIKGANLLVDSNGTVKLADFGMAKHLNEARLAYSTSGTAYWMAPEVLQASLSNKDSGYNTAIDIWSLGCTIIEMYTGKHPWNGYQEAAAMFRALRYSPEIPKTLSSEGKDFLQLCFRRNPNERPSASELLEHRFITSSNGDEFHGSVEAFSEVKVFDDSHLSTNDKLFKLHTATKVKQITYCDTARSTEAIQVSSSRISPRSTLEAVPNFSPLSIQVPIRRFGGLQPNSVNGYHYSLA